MPILAFDQMARLVTGMEVFRFDLAVNSGLLNKWQPAALVLSGLIPADPFANQDPVPAVALDAVSSLDNAEVSSAIDPLAAVAEVADEAGDALTAANDIVMKQVCSFSLFSVQGGQTGGGGQGRSSREPKFSGTTKTRYFLEVTT